MFDWLRNLGRRIAAFFERPVQELMQEPQPVTAKFTPAVKPVPQPVSTQQSSLPTMKAVTEERIKRERERQRIIEEGKKASKRLGLKVATVAGTSAKFPVEEIAERARKTPDVTQVAGSPEKMAQAYGGTPSAVERLNKILLEVGTGRRKGAGLARAPLDLVLAALDVYNEKVVRPIAKKTGLTAGLKKLFSVVPGLRSIRPETRDKIAEFVAESLADPLNYVGVGLVGRAARGVSAVARALESAEAAARAAKGVEEAARVAEGIAGLARVAEAGAKARLKALSQVERAVRASRTAADVKRVEQAVSGLGKAKAAAEVNEGVRKLAEAASRAEHLTGRAKTIERGAQARLAGIERTSRKIQQSISSEASSIERLRARMSEQSSKLREVVEQAAKALEEATAPGVEPTVAARHIKRYNRLMQTANRLRDKIIDTGYAISASGDRIDRLRAALQMAEKAKAEEASRLAAAQQALKIGKRSLEARIQAAVDDLVRAVEKARAVEEERLARVAEKAQAAAFKKTAAEEALKMAEQAREKLPSLRRQVLVEEQPELAVKAGFLGKEVPLVRLPGVQRWVERELYALKQQFPTVYNWLVRNFRYGRPTVRAGEPFEEYKARRVAMPLVHQMLGEAGARARIEGAEATARKWAELGVPRKYREYAAPFAEIDALPVGLSAEELRYIRRSADVYRKSMDEIEGVLRRELGEEYMGHVDRYVSHVFLKRGKDFADVDVAQTAEALGMVRRAARRMPGSRPGFTRHRTADITIVEAERLGLEPVKDVALLDTMYRWAAQLVLEEKKVTDWLEAHGWIRALRDAPAGWVEGYKVAPWLKGKAVHPDMAGLLASGRQAIIAMDEAAESLIRLWDKVTSVWKGMVTSARPGFHLKNLLGNFFLMRLGGIPFSRMPDLFSRALYHMVKHTNLFDEFRRLGLEGQGMVRDVAAPQALVKRAEDILNRAMGSPKRILGFINPLKGGRELGEFVDSWARLAAYIFYREQGFNPVQAAMRVRNALLDYSMLTPTERAIRRWAFPFYAWLRHSIPRFIVGSLQHPGVLPAYRRLQEKMAEKENVDMRDLPSWLQHAIIVDVDDQNRIVILDPSPPGQEITSVLGYEGAGDVGSQLLGGLARTVVSALHPAASVPSLLIGIDPRSGRQIVQTKYYGLPEGLQKLGAVLSTLFLPKTDIEKLRLGELSPALKPVEQFLGVRPSEKPLVYERYYPGLLGFATPVLSRYDRPLAEAIAAQRVSGELDRLLREMYQATGALPEGLPEETKKEIAERPTHVASKLYDVVEKKVREQEKEEATRRAWESVWSDPGKQRIIYWLTEGARDRNKAAEDLVRKYPKLFTMPAEEIDRFLGWLYSPQNVQKVMARLQRVPNRREVLDYAKELLEDEMGIKPFETRKPLSERERMELKGVFSPPGTASRPGSATELLRRHRADRLLAGTDVAFSQVVEEAMKVTGVGLDWVPFLWWLAARESNFDPQAVNTESGATGLMQTLPSTFRQYTAPGMTDITNPVHNLVAAIRYIQARYGHPKNIPGILQWDVYRGY